MRIVFKSGSLNLLEPLGPVQACNGVVLPLHEDQCPLTIISLAEVFLDSQTFEAEDVDQIRTHILCSITPPPQNRAVYEKMWTKYCTAGQATGENITRRMPFARRITKATDTHSEYVILIAFPLQ